MSQSAAVFKSTNIHSCFQVVVISCARRKQKELFLFQVYVVKKLTTLVCVCVYVCVQILYCDIAISLRRALFLQ